jgi:hypothetical protein
MRLVEYRILMPFSIDEFRIGQSWSYCESSLLNTGGGVGIQVLKRELFDLPSGYLDDLTAHLPEYSMLTKKEKTSAKKTNVKPESAEDVNNKIENVDRSKKCKYVVKQHNMDGLVPWLIQKLSPKDALIMIDKTWSMYPIIKTQMSNNFLKDKYHIYFDTIIKEYKDNTYEDNVHDLTPEQLAKREIIYIDISKNVSSSDYVESEDPRKFKSTVTGRGPLLDDNWWADPNMPIICVYLLVECELKAFGLQTKIENSMVSMNEKTFTKIHREIFCWQDRWFNINENELEKIESDLQEKLNSRIKNAEKVTRRFAEDDD